MSRSFWHAFTIRALPRCTKPAPIPNPARVLQYRSSPWSTFRAPSPSRTTRGRKGSPRDRLALFERVCEAVHHGHQRGIIHRDLKPANILVDSHGDPKIIDFGVARGTDSDTAVTTLQTDVGQLLGTLQYMSPEQCEGDPHDIDTRSDVYALSVVLYEVLAGQPPYDVSRGRIFESTRVIREESPKPLSTFSSALRGDVETIVRKALEKDRDRRYQSALELGQDIGRYLAGDAIMARPPSIAYQFRVFARRHSTLLATACAVLLMLVAGLVVSGGLYLRAERARAETVVERDRAIGAEQEAEKHRAEAVAVIDFLSGLLASVEPAQALGRDVTIREVLDKAADDIEGSFADEPRVEATLRATIGNTYRALGLYKPAEVHLRRALQLRRDQFGEKS